jgi:hypothetical protein
LWPTRCANMSTMASDYAPDEEASRLYARHKRHHDGALELRDPVKEQAAQDLLAGATPAQLAKLTGLSDEFFRRIARAVGAERKREPTVGRDAKKKQAADSPGPPRDRSWRP